MEARQWARVGNRYHQCNGQNDPTVCNGTGRAGRPALAQRKIPPSRLRTSHLNLEGRAVGHHDWQSAGIHRASHTKQSGMPEQSSTIGMRCNDRAALV